MLFRVVILVFCFSAVAFCETEDVAARGMRSYIKVVGTYLQKGRELLTSLSKEDVPKTSANSTDCEKKQEYVTENEICYHPLGCFSLEGPWKSSARPIFAPLSPDEISAFIRFHNRENLEKEVNITLYPETKMNGAPFDPTKQTMILVHGFANSGNATWMKDLMTAYLKHVDGNVMLVDWGKGAQMFNYLQVAGNTRLVGRQLEKFVRQLVEQHRADPKKFHLIGHSLGAHICAYLAKGVRGIARITALDPAQPGFEGFDEVVRLSHNDADFVDVVHTDGRPLVPTLGFGMIKPVGHVDFYLNGGFAQPGCLVPQFNELSSIKGIGDLAKYPVELIGKIVACPHGRAYEYFTEALNETEECIFWGQKPNIQSLAQSATNGLTQGLLKTYLALPGNCTVEKCIPMGLYTPMSSLRGVFLITTDAREPYCLSKPGRLPNVTSLIDSVAQMLL